MCKATLIIRCKESDGAWNRADPEVSKAGIKVELNPERRSPLRSAAEYIKNAKDRDASEAALQARNATKDFLEIVKERCIDEVILLGLCPIGIPSIVTTVVFLLRRYRKRGANTVAETKRHPLRSILCATSLKCAR
jgi:hypothetical protein